MQKFKKCLTALIAITILGINLIVAKPSQAITYKYTWKGDSGYSARGTFSYDETQDYSLITPDELDSLTIAFFDPLNHLIKEYRNIEKGDSTNINDFLKFQFNPLTKSLVELFDVGEGNLIGAQDFYLKGNIGSYLELRNLDTHVLDKNAGHLTVEKVEEDLTKTSDRSSQSARHVPPLPLSSQTDLANAHRVDALNASLSPSAKAPKPQS